MKNRNSLKFIFISATIYLLIIIVVFLLALNNIDSPTVTIIVGTVIGSIGGVLGFFVNAWIKDRELKEKIKDREEQIRDRSARYALELTKMDFELRQESLKLVKGKRLFLAPIKVYRELYKALLELHKKGTWPKTIENLGLLNIFPLGSENDDLNKNNKK